MSEEVNAIGRINHFKPQNKICWVRTTSVWIFCHHIRGIMIIKLSMLGPDAPVLTNIQDNCILTYIYIYIYISFTAYFFGKNPTEKQQISALLVRRPCACPGRLQWHYRIPLTSTLPASKPWNENLIFSLPRRAISNICAAQHLRRARAINLSKIFYLNFLLGYWWVGRC